MPQIWNRVKSRVSHLLPGHYYDDEDNDQDTLEDEARSMLSAGKRRASHLWDGFMDFALQGNILEIAFGLILAAAFTTLVTSLISDIILPPISVLLPLDKNMEEKFAVLKPGPHIPSNGYTTLKRAQDDGAVVMAYGVFVNKCVSFLGLGLALYGVAGVYQWVSKDDIIKRKVKCRYCRKNVSEKALRCINCTSWLDGREDQVQMRPNYNTASSSQSALMS